jgi:hypothetical protein
VHFAQLFPAAGDNPLFQLCGGLLGEREGNDVVRARACENYQAQYQPQNFNLVVLMPNWNLRISRSATFVLLLRLTDGRTYTLLRRMKPFGKVGVSLMSLLLLATPIMACLVPAAAMTAAERDCCKRMAQECGNNGMPQSHSCCQTTTVPDHLAAIKSSSDVNSQHPTLFVAYAVHPELAIATMLESGSSSWAAADIHSPPTSPPVAISVLRI